MKLREYRGKRSSSGVPDLRLANRKSQARPFDILREGSEFSRRIQNLKWLGSWVIAFVLMACVGIAEGQQPKKNWLIGFLSSVSPDPYAHLYTAFLQGLRDSGYIDGQNVTVKPRWAEDNTERLPELAAELVGLKVDLMVATGTATALAAKASTTSIPIVFTAGGDLVKVGLISSLARPGGNLTGLSLLTTELNIKRLELLKESFPKIRRVGVLGNPANPNYRTQLDEIQAAAKQLGLEIQILETRDPNELETVVSKVSNKSVGALLVLSDPTLNAHRQRIAEVTSKTRLPTIFEFKEFVEAGGLMSYGTNIIAVYRRVAVFVDKIFKGARPSEMPVEQPTNLEFLINLKTANQIGVTIPPNVLARADKVIR